MATLQAEAFKRLYSEEYFDRFIQEGLRPDGRSLGVCRPVTVALNAVSSADGSAIAKVRRINGDVVAFGMFLIGLHMI